MSAECTLDAMRVGSLTLAVLACFAGCGTTWEPQEANVITLRFTGDTNSEVYVCFGFDAALLDGAAIGGIALDAASGPVALHHVSLYASPSQFSAGPLECEAMPTDAVPLHVWAIGGTALVLPDDIELVVPEQTASLIVQAHVLRLGDGPARERNLTVTTRRGALHRAGWLPLRAPVPALRPQHREESAATCAIANDLHVISTWPHMHQAGAEFRGSVIVGASPSTFVDVDPWQYDAQQAYDTDVLVASTSSIETRCIWQNDSDQTILPGPLVTNEMCGQSLMGWPVEAAHCE